MPTYGEAKIRDIAESILPSTARRRAREERKAIHRRERRRVRQTFFDEADIVGDDRKVRIAIDQMKWERRGADKLGPLMRWAEASTSSIEDPVERYMQVKALMPDNLIGRHALSHVRQVDGIEPPGENPYAYSYGGRRPARERDYRAALLRVVEDCRHRDLNAAMRACHRLPVANTTERKILHPQTGAVIRREYDYEYGHVVRFQKNTKGWYSPRRPIIVPCTCGPRLFKGLHDIDDFLAEVNRRGVAETDWQEFVSHHPERRKALDAFLDEHYPLA